MKHTAPALCLTVALLFGAAGCESPAVTYPPGAPPIISGFKSRTGIDGRWRRAPHQGIDLKGHSGQEILAAADGLVLEAVVDECWGPTIAVDHGRGSDGEPIIALYGHVGDMLVTSGDNVARGQVIARITDNHHEFRCIWGVPHLHFQIGREYKRYNKANRWGYGYFLVDGQMSIDPNLYWADGPYRVTCFDPNAVYKKGTLTYPVPCDRRPRNQLAK